MVIYSQHGSYPEVCPWCMKTFLAEAYDAKITPRLTGILMLTPQDMSFLKALKISVDGDTRALSK
jgi:hypothetical protein